MSEKLRLESFLDPLAAKRLSIFSVTPEAVSTPDAGTPKGTTPEPPEDSEPSTPTTDDPQALKEFDLNVELHKAENKFVRGIAKDLDDTEKATAKMLRDAKAILNKLTPEKEENLTRRFVNEIQPDSYDRLVRLVNDLFNKAIEEKHFAQLYARLCKTCHIRWTDMDRFQFACRPNGEHIQEEMSKQDIERAPQKFKLKSFREVLLSRAQQEFNKLKKLNSQDKETFEKDSYEWRRLDTKEKLDALPKKDSPEVFFQLKAVMII